MRRRSGAVRPTADSRRSSGLTDHGRARCPGGGVPAACQTGPVGANTRPRCVYESLPDTEGRSQTVGPRRGSANITRIIEAGVAESARASSRPSPHARPRIRPDQRAPLRWRGHQLHFHPRVRQGPGRSSARFAWIRLYGAWFHLGVVQYLSGEFADRGRVVLRKQPIAPDANEHRGFDGLALDVPEPRRPQDGSEGVLDRRSPTFAPDYGYTRRLQVYARRDYARQAPDSGRHR